MNRPSFLFSPGLRRALAAGMAAGLALALASAVVPAGGPTSLIRGGGTVSTTTTVVSSADPSTVGQLVTFTATVSGSPEPETPTGTVTFFDGTSSIGSATLSSGTAAITTSSLAVGSHPIQAEYGGDATFEFSGSAPLTQTVNPAATTTAVDSSANPSTVEQAVTFTATVSPVPDGGTVSFTDGGTPMTGCSFEAVSAAGTAPCQVTYTAVGSHSITATYSGDTNFAPSSDDTLTQTVNPAATPTALSTPTAPAAALAGAPFSVSTVLTRTDGGAVPAGTSVVFEVVEPDGTQLSMFAVTDPTGLATVTITNPPSGVFTVTTSFPGTESLAPSSSGSAQVSVYQPVLLTMPPSVTGTAGGRIALTARVTTVPDGAPVPGQTVTFSDSGFPPGFPSCDALTDANGIATCNVAWTGFPGAATVTATFENPADFFTDHAGDLPPQPEIATTTLQIVAPTALSTPTAPAAALAGAPFSVSTVLTRTDGGAVPAGTSVVFEVVEPDGTQLSMFAVTDPTGLATVTITNPPSGVFTVTTSFPGTESLAPSSSGSAQVSVYQPVLLTMPPSVTGTAGGRIALTARVTTVPDGAPVPGQTVTFSDSGFPPGFPSCDALTDANGIATCNVAWTGFPGAATVTATFENPADFFTDHAGDLPPQPEIATTTLQISAATTTAVASSANPSTVGQAVTFTATVSPVPGGGTVSFTDGGTPITGCSFEPVSSTGTAICQVTYTAVGSHPITASYGGDANFAPSSADTLTQKVNRASSAASLVSTPNPSTVGQPVTLTATVAANPLGAGTPTGTVTFSEGGAVFGSAALNGNGTAAVTTSFTAAGSHPITASYEGDANFAPSSADTLTQTVNPAATTTAVVSSANPSTVGQPVTFTVTVTGPLGAGTPTGTVDFADGGSDFGFVIVNGSPTSFTGEITTSFTAAGAHLITATYEGDANFAGSSGSLTQTVVPTLVVVTTSPLPRAQVGAPYLDNLAASGGTPPYTWSLSGGTLPTGLSLDSSGAITGIPSAPGTATFTVVVADASMPRQTATSVQLSLTVPVPPVVTSISPTFGPGRGGTTVTISGNNLCDVSAVHFGTVSSHATVIHPPTGSVCTVSAVSPPGTGVVDVTVTDPGGTSLTGPQDHFSYTPVVTSISPTFGPGRGGTTVTVSGNNLCDVSAVHFGTVSSHATVIHPPTGSVCTVSAVSPPGTGVVDVTLTDPGGISLTGPQDDFSYTPAVTSISPTFGPAHGQTTVTISGNNLCDVSAAHFGPNPSPSVRVTPPPRGSSVCTVSAVSPPGTAVVDVTLTDPGGTSLTGPQDDFSYTPVVTSISPTFGPAGGGTTVTISGNNFCGVSAVHFGPNPSPIVKVTPPAGSVCSVSAVSPPGTAVVDVTLTGPGGISLTGPQDDFSYAPVVTSISPTFGPAGGGTTVIISGKNLCGVSAVHFGPNPSPIVKVTPLAGSVCSVSAVSPPGTAVVDVTLTGPGGISLTGPQDDFSYAPVVTSISPTFGPAGGGTTVIISGKNLCGVSAVDFGPNPSPSVRGAPPAGSVCNGSISAVAPPGTGVVDVTLIGPGGSSLTGPQDDFSYAPVVTSISPTFGPAGGGITVIINGNNLCGVSAVDFGPNPSPSVRVTLPPRGSSVCSVLAVSPLGTGVLDVTLTGPGGTSLTAPQDQFSYR